MTDFGDIYQSLPNLQNLTWYGVVGNNDFSEIGLESELFYDQNGWRIDDYFWSRIQKIGDKKIAFVHIDTNYLAYGQDGAPDKEHMKTYFRKLRWTEEYIL